MIRVAPVAVRKKEGFTPRRSGKGRGTPLHPFLDSYRVLYFWGLSKLLKIDSNKGVDCYILRDLIGLI